MNKKFSISILVLLLGAAGTLAYFKYFSGPEIPKLPDPKEQKPSEIANQIASEDFTKLPQKAKEAYLENLINMDKVGEIFYSSHGMSEDQRKNLRENMRTVFDLRTKKSADEYYALPKEKREEYLDKEIDKFAERMAERQRTMEQGGTGGSPGGGFWSGGRGDGGGGGPPPGQGTSGRRRGPTTQQVKERIETTDPATRAKVAQYRKELRERMQQRRTN